MNMELLVKRGNNQIILIPEWVDERAILKKIPASRLNNMSVCKATLGGKACIVLSDNHKIKRKDQLK